MRRNLPRSFDELAGLRARGLVRESTVEQGDNSGPTVQRQDEEAFALRHGLRLEQRTNAAGELEPFLYTDLVSGSDAAKRPEFLQMIVDAKAGQFDVLLVRDTSRFSRNWRQAGGYEEQLHKAGVVVAYIMEGKLSTDPSAQLQIVVNHSINEDYRTKLAKNVSDGFRIKRFQAGKFSGSIPIGYVMEYEQVWNPNKRTTEPRDTGRLLPDDELRARVGHDEAYSSADLVRHIGELYATGQHGFRSLALAIKADGYRKASGQALSSDNVRKILQSPTFAGFLSWHHRADKRQRGDTGELVEASWEPLWSRELWDQILEVRRRNFHGATGGRARYAYPFRRVALCDRCGGRLFGEIHRDVPYMACATQRERRECEQPGIQAGLLEDQVGDWLASLHVPAEWRTDIVRIQRATAARSTSRPRVDRAKVDGQLSRLKALFVMGDVTREEYVEQRRELVAGLEESPTDWTYSDAVLARAAQLVGDLGELWAKATTAERQEIVQSLFAWVRVRDKRIVRAKLARDEYQLLVASASVREWVGLAPLEGTGAASPTFVIEGVEELVERLQAS